MHRGQQGATWAGAEGAARGPGPGRGCVVGAVRAGADVDRAQRGGVGAGGVGPEQLWGLAHTAQATLHHRKETLPSRTTVRGIPCASNEGRN